MKAEGLENGLQIQMTIHEMTYSSWAKAAMIFPGQKMFLLLGSTSIVLVDLDDG